MELYSWLENWEPVIQSIYFTEQEKPSPWFVQWLDLKIPDLFQYYCFIKHINVYIIFIILLLSRDFH